MWMPGTWVCKKVVGSGGIESDESEGGVGENRKGGRGRIDRGRSRGNIRELIHGKT